LYIATSFTEDRDVPVRLARYSHSCGLRSRSGGRFALAALFVLFGCSGLQTVVAEGDTRSLSFQHTHRDDSITVTFKRNGRYDEDGLKKLNHFLRDWRNNDETRMDPQLFDILWEVTREVGAEKPIHIISSYRSPQTNAMLRRRSRGVAQFSQHTLGKAIDFSIPGVPLDQIRAAGLRLQRGGVGFYPGSGFVHVDVGSIRHWPRMTHDQLVRVFPDGKTVHVPSDGNPLKNYSAALAEVQRRGSTPSATSLAAAQSAGIKIADASGAAPGRGRSVLAKLLGIGANEEDARAAGEGQRILCGLDQQAGRAGQAGRVHPGFGQHVGGADAGRDHPLARVLAGAARRCDAGGQQYAGCQQDRAGQRGCRSDRGTPGLGQGTRRTARPAATAEGCRPADAGRDHRQSQCVDQQSESERPRAGRLGARLCGGRLRGDFG
jgi:uncharacterized protein YcbK (DUF882 family)